MIRGFEDYWDILFLVSFDIIFFEFKWSCSEEFLFICNVIRLVIYGFYVKIKLWICIIKSLVNILISF